MGHLETWAKNEELSFKFSEEVGAIYVLRSDAASTSIYNSRYRIRFKDTSDLKNIAYFLSTFPHNRYVLFSPHAFVDLKEAVLSRIQMGQDLSEIDRHRMGEAIDLANEIRIRHDILFSEVKKLRESWFLRVVCRIFGVNLDIIQKWEEHFSHLKKKRDFEDG